MRDLIMEELNTVSGGEVVCTIGTGGISCTGTTTEWADEIFSAYDQAVRSFTDFFEWIDDALTDDDEGGE